MNLLHNIEKIIDEWIVLYEYVEKDKPFEL